MFDLKLFDILHITFSLQVKLILFKYITIIFFIFINNVENKEDNEDNKKKSLKTKYELNEIGSWLCSFPVYGDVVICSLSCDGFTSFTKTSFISCIQASLPSGLWSNDSINKHFVNMPLWYHSPAWNSLRPKLPITLLHEILTRRSIESSFQKEIIICNR